LNLKSFVCVAALAFLASCSQAASTYVPASPSSLNNPDLAPSKKYNGPTFSIAIELPNRLHPNGGATFESLKATMEVGKKKYVFVGDGFCPGASDSGGKTYGCEILSSGSKVWKIKSSTFFVYAKQHAKGCVLAEDHFKGTIGEGTVVFSNLKAVNTKSCWS
jgi:hypothetical protein